MVRDELDSVHDVARLNIVHRVMKADAAPPGLYSPVSLANPLTIALGCWQIDAE